MTTTIKDMIDPISGNRDATSLDKTRPGRTACILQPNPANQTGTQQTKQIKLTLVLRHPRAQSYRPTPSQPPTRGGSTSSRRHTRRITSMGTPNKLIDWVYPGVPAACRR